MLIPDVNILVHAWRAESADHARARAWLEDAAGPGEGLGLVDQVAAGAIRVLTQRVSGLGADINEILLRVDELRAAPGVTIIRPRQNHWAIFSSLCRELSATGNLIPDCYLAALAMENTATFVSRDRFFASVPGLTWNDLPE